MILQTQTITMVLLCLVSPQRSGENSARYSLQDKSENRKLRCNFRQQSDADICCNTHHKITSGACWPSINRGVTAQQ